MLFLAKRTWPAALLGLLLLTPLGLALRHFVGGPEITFTPSVVLLGVGVVGLVLVSDGIIHISLFLIIGHWYRRRHRELAALFRGQSLLAILLGALMAGVGEELVFRGLTLDPILLTLSAVVFGLLHHVRRPLWPFTIWAIWQGLLFTAALLWTQDLAVTMVAHFLHDLTGFLVFRVINKTERQPAYL
jgi:uncharacterized protein